MIPNAQKGALINTSIASDEIDTSHVLADERPVSKHKLYGAKRFWGFFAAEHVAATEFLWGVTFVAWGVGMRDVFLGLLLGNLLSVFFWIICGQIAVDTRLTLYAYLKKIAGPHMQKFSNVLNAVYFGIVAAFMITVTATAVRELLGIPVQLNWYPTSLAFVIVVLVIGMITAVIAAYGFGVLSYISSLVGPWLLTLFLVAGIVSVPILMDASTAQTSGHFFSDFLQVGNEYVWVSNPDSPMTIWHIMAFAMTPLGHNLALSDMSLFRHGKKNYGYTTIIAKYFGHFIAWICAGVLGMAAAVMMNTDLEFLDSGAIAFAVLGLTGTIAVLISGITTTYPKLYRIGTAVQAINPKWSLKKIILNIGFFISVLATFPILVDYAMEIVVLFGAALASVGVIVITEHFIFPKIGYTRYWATYKGLKLNKAALSAWIIATGTSMALTLTGTLHVNFQPFPIILISSIGYIILAGRAGAKEDYSEEEEKARLLQEQIIIEVDEAALKDLKTNGNKESKSSLLSRISLILIVLSIVVFLGSGVLFVNKTLTLNDFQNIALISTITYYVFAVLASKDMKKEA